MAKTSSIEKNNRRAAMIKRDAKKRQALKAVVMNREASAEDRFQAALKLAELQVQTVPHRAARPGQRRADPRRRQGQLVKEAGQ